MIPRFKDFTIGRGEGALRFSHTGPWRPREEVRARRLFRRVTNRILARSELRDFSPNWCEEDCDDFAYFAVYKGGSPEIYGAWLLMEVEFLTPRTFEAISGYGLPEIEERHSPDAPPFDWELARRVHDWMLDNDFELADGRTVRFSRSKGLKDADIKYRALARRILPRERR